MEKDMKRNEKHEGQSVLWRRIRTAREALGVSRRALAARLMIPVYHLEMIEEGGLPASMTLETIAQKELGISTEWLLTGEGEMLKESAKEIQEELQPPVTKEQAFYRERPLADSLYLALDERRQRDNAMLGYGRAIESEEELNEYIETLDGTRLSKKEAYQLSDLVGMVEADMQRIFYLHGLTDGLRLIMEAMQAGRDNEAERDVFRKVLRGCGITTKEQKSVCTKTGRKGP